VERELRAQVTGSVVAFDLFNLRQRISGGFKG
jgi:hypothetical protein